MAHSYSRPVTTKAKVCFFFQGVKVSLANRKELKRYIQSIFKKEGKKSTSLNYIFCTDKVLLEINRQYLKHDFYTDIITFDLSETNSVLGEIYISVERVKENALELGVSFKSEFHRVIFHGVLHLCGYKDKSREEKDKMREKEEFYLAKYFK
jgi:probable rRNA maturation factor